MRHLPFVAAAILMLSPPAQAQFLMSSDCRNVEAQMITIADTSLLINVSRTATSRSQNTSQGCSVTNIEVRSRALETTFRVDRASFRGQGLRNWVRGDGALAPALELTLDGITFLRTPDLPADLAPLAALRADTITLSLTWDERENRIRLAPLRVDFGDNNTFALSIDGVAPDWQPGDLSADPELISAAVDVSFNGLFEQIALPPLRANDIDLSPTSIGFFAAMASGLMASAPRSLVGQEAQDEIVAFINALPAPRGVLSVALSDDAPFDPAQIWEDIEAGARLSDALPQGLSLTANWTPEN